MATGAQAVLLKQARDSLNKALETGLQVHANEAKIFLSAALAEMEKTPKPSPPASGGCGAAPSKPASKKNWKPRCKFGLDCKQGMDCKFFHTEAELDEFRAKQYTEDHDCEREMCCPCCPCPNNPADSDDDDD
jgi:hypothetical protein